MSTALLERSEPLGVTNLWDHYRKSINNGEKYLHYHSLDMMHVAKKIYDISSIKRASTVLDLGCGPGLLLKEILSRSSNNLLATGVDISSDQILEAKRRSTNASFFCMDALEYLKKQKPGSVDFITCVDVAEHLETNELIAIFSEACRVLRRGGEIFVRVPNAMAIANPILYGDLTHKRAFTRESLVQLGNYANLDVIEFTGSYFEGNSSYNVLRELILKLFYYPFLKNFYRLLYGNKCGGHYSSNVYCVFGKKPT